MAKLSEPQVYICKKYPKYKFRIEKKHYQFENGQLQVHTEEDVEALDNVLDTIPAIALLVAKVDKDAAEAFVREQMKKKDPFGGAVKGTVDSQDILNSQKPLAERDAALSGLEQSQMDALTDELAKDSDLIMTQKVENPVVSTTEKPTEKPKLDLGLKEKK
jgi:hypothetical protein